MCGIVAVVRRRSERRPPTTAEVLGLLSPAAVELRDRGTVEGAELATVLRSVGGAVAEADRLLRGSPGMRALVADRALVAQIEQLAGAIERDVAAIEAELDRAGRVAGPSSEAVNAALLALKDTLWAVGRDRLRTARAVQAMAGAAASEAGLDVYLSVQQTLSALDRLEVRGRDSAGLHLLVRGHGLDLDAPGLAERLAARSADPLFRNGSLRVVDGMLSIVYKAAAEIGELGDNTRALREALDADAVLHQALAGDDVEAVVLAHTRWASVGIISEPNAHPLNSDQVGPDDHRPYVTAVLNGDVDNFGDLKAEHGLRIDPLITTDAKVIPTIMSQHLAGGMELGEAFRRTVADFEGSVAIAAGSSAEPGGLQLALRGSGQALYVGLAEDTYIVASEPYGVVEETAHYIRMDGETPGNPDNETASRGQTVALDGSLAGRLEGIERRAYDGTTLPLTSDEVVSAEITTRDIDRGDYRHYLLKEISEAPTSFRKTLRGKIVDRGGWRVELGDDTLPSSIRERLGAGAIRRILVIGQGTAAIAGRSVAEALIAELDETQVLIDALPATELSGFELRGDMSDTLIVAISQSGTTTDTNRTVDLVRSRGAAVVAIVNRRNSDLTDKADGVLYTSDGRDVEMSVASTKAFYSQVAAGFLLACAVADEVDSAAAARPERAQLLDALLALPDAMDRVLLLRPAIGEAARRSAPGRRYWAIVGNGRNLIAANEIRIKLSELCYKSIACDSTEDKKHIDLSSEPLILVCAAGLAGSTAADVAKEIAIYRAHKAAPIVVADESENRFDSAIDVIAVPSVSPQVAFVLSTMVGHLFGYEAALAIDEQAQPLRQTRAVIEVRFGEGDASPAADALEMLRPAITPHAERFFDGLRDGSYDGHVEASTAARLASAYRYALGILPLDAYQIDHGKVGTPSVVVDDLMAALTLGIEELTRPIDAIKHQAKTVTVGISRSDESLLQVPLVVEVTTAGAPRDQLSYRTLRTLAELNPAVAEVTGYTRYRIEGDVVGYGAQVFVVDRGGISLDLPSRADRNPALLGTKHRVAAEREVLVTTGRRDGRTIVIVPEVKGNQTMGLTLLHVRFHDRLDAGIARSVLRGYRDRFTDLHDAVTETEPTFREDQLADVPVVDLLVAPVSELADRWRT